MTQNQSQQKKQDKKSSTLHFEFYANLINLKGKKNKKQETSSAKVVSINNYGKDIILIFF